MNIDELIAHNVQITISASDLKAFAMQIASEILKRRDNDRELMSPDEVVEYLKISRSTLQRWDRTGYIKRRQVGGKPMYSRSEIDRVTMQ